MWMGFGCFKSPQNTLEDLTAFTEKSLFRMEEKRYRHEMIHPGEWMNE